jgi:hypothetical protein
MSRGVRRSSHVVLIAAIVAALTACGGSSEKTAKTPGAPTSSSSASNSSTTKPVLTATEPAGAQIAAKAALQLADVGSGFGNYRKGRGVEPVGAESCHVIAPGAFLTTRDHAYDGPMFKKKDATFYAYSTAYVFRTEALAKRFVSLRSTAAFKQCKVKQDDAAERKANANSYVKLTPVQWSDPGHIPTMYRELTGRTTGGKQVDGGFYDRYTLRQGRVVVVINVDSNLAKDDAGSQAIANQTGEILRALDTALATRLAAV